MTNRHLLLLVGLTLVTVFLLASAWEFALVNHAPAGLAGEVGSNLERWEFIIVSMALTAVAMLVPVLVCVRVIADRKRVCRTLRLAHQELGNRVEERTAGLRDAIKALREEIAQRKRAETLLHQSEERFRRLVENVEGVFWMTDPAMNELLYVSPAYEEIWGRPSKDLYRDPMLFVGFVHPDDRSRVMAALGRAATGTYDEEYRIQRPDGSIRWIRDRAFPVRDDTGSVQCIVGMAEDLTTVTPPPQRPHEAAAAHGPGRSPKARGRRNRAPTPPGEGSVQRP